jgi:hypothetical protein
MVRASYRKTCEMLDDIRLTRAVAIAAPAILPGLPTEIICREHLKFDDNEIESGRILSSRSSAVVVANTFGPFLQNPNLLPSFIDHLNFTPATFVGLEHCAYFPWSRSHGRHPRLDVMMESEDHLIGIEAKRYEPFDQQRPAIFKKAYWLPVWGDRMQPFERLRDRLDTTAWVPRHLDAAQLVKHGLGLHTEAARRNKRPVLIYLMAEPSTWPDGTPIDDEARSEHAAEAIAFGEHVRGSEVEMWACTYRQLLEAMRHSHVLEVRKHAWAVAAKYDI